MESLLHAPGVAQSNCVTESDILAAARCYVGRGWSVIPLPRGAKKPGCSRWQRLRIHFDELERYFGAAVSNIGVLLGEPSNWLIDVDLDHPECVARADEFLPTTPAIFGRPGKRRSHRLYRVTAPTASKKCQSRSAGMLVELRSTGLQTVFPPSSHPSGELITWEQAEAEPAVVEPSALLSAVGELADAVRADLGERRDREAAQRDRAKRCASGPTQDARLPIARAVAAMLRIRRADMSDGSLRLYMAACRAVEYGLCDDDALRAIRQYEGVQPFPRAWTDTEIGMRLRDAEARIARGAALELDEQGHTRLGYAEPGSGRLVLSAKRTLPTVQAYLREFHDHPDGMTLRSQSGQFIAWRGNRYVPISESELAQQLLWWLHEAHRCVVRTNGWELAPFPANPSTVRAALNSLHSATYLPDTVSPPSWLADVVDRPSPAEIIACCTGLLHLPTMRSLPASPAFFTHHALEFDYDPNAPPPQRWFKFLDQLFESDPESQALLQEWFGYSLTGDTSQQKMLLIVGPRRSGKGTIARVLTRLLGPHNVAGPTTSSLAGPFGLQALIGKALAIVSDARFAGGGVQTVIERLLCISGEDILTIDRKHMTSATMKLPRRFVFLSNELPLLNDASGAIAGRFMLLRLKKSFFGQEDTQLTPRLLDELPGILNWAISGWHRLAERGRFVQPGTIEIFLDDMVNLSSPVGAFIRECCVIGPGRRASIDELYMGFRRWAEANGRATFPTKHWFGRDLVTVIPDVTVRVGTGNRRFYDGVELCPLDAGIAPANSAERQHS